MQKDRRWEELIQAIATEKDPKKLHLACQEINRISAQRESQDGASTCASPTS
jgi:hypothetical protein